MEQNHLLLFNHFLNLAQAIMTESRWNADDLHPPLLNVQKPASAEIKFST